MQTISQLFLRFVSAACLLSSQRQVLPSSLLPREISHPPVEGSGLSSIASDGQHFVAVGSRNTILRSEDGLVWQQQFSDADVCFQSVVAGNGMFLALTHCKTTLISRDGIQWDQRKSPGGIVRSAAFGKGRFVTVGESGTIMVSSNAATWASCDGNLPQSLACVRYGEDRFVAVGAYGKIINSADGWEWTRQDSGTDRRLHGLVWGDGMWVAVGNGGTILSSKDGKCWNQCESGTEDCLHAVAFGGGVFVAVGWKGRLLISRDARTWRTIPSCGGNLYDIAYGHGRFVAVGHRNTILTIGTEFDAGSSFPAAQGGRQILGESSGK